MSVVSKSLVYGWLRYSSSNGSRHKHDSYELCSKAGKGTVSKFKAKV